MSTPGTHLSGRKFFLISFVILFVFGFWLTQILPTWINRDLAYRVILKDQRFATLESALQAYAVEHGAFPPEFAMEDYRLINEEFFNRNTAGQKALPVNLLTTPIAFLTDPEDGEDPYDLPIRVRGFEESRRLQRHYYGPPAYMNFGEFALIYIKGPNIQFDFLPNEMRDYTTQDELESRLTPFTYDPTNGLKSDGVFWKIISKPE